MKPDARVLVMVAQLLTPTTFRGTWRGQSYEVRGVPDVSSVAVGDSVFCRYVPGSTQLLAIFLAVVPEQLWWTPGSRNSDYVGELWRLATLTGTPEMVWECPNPASYEAITHIFWSQVDSHLYVVTHDYDYAPQLMLNRIYQVNTTTGACSLVVSWNRPHLYGLNLRNWVDPVIDSAEHGAYIYLWENGFMGGAGDGFSNLERFDPIAGTVTLSVNFLDELADAYGYFGGVAVDPVTNKLVVSDGWTAYNSPSGNPGSFVFDADLTIIDAPSNSYDNFPLQTFVNADNLVYGGMGSSSTDADSVVARRIAAGNWVADLNPGNARANGFVSFCRSHSAGSGGALWAQRWAWFYATDRAEVWTKPDGGAWAKDWDGPPLADKYHTPSSQSLAYSWSKIWSLLYTGYFENTRLYRRDAAGTYALVQQWNQYYPQVSYTYTLAICTSPGKLLKCHEV